MVTQEKQDEILYVGFNQDQGCFATGTQKGFRIYNTKPYKEQFIREFDGGIGIVEMLFRCNILALVGGGARPKFPPNKVMLWDDHQLKCIGELSFRTVVKAVRLRKDKVVVVLENRIYVYNFADLRLIDAIDTCNNPRGLCALNPETNQAVLATPDREQGLVRLTIFEKKGNQTIQAHQNALFALALTASGHLLATASEKGTLIRIFSTADRTCLQETRRGTDRAEITCLQFDKLSKWLAVSSDKQTIHLFVVEVGKVGIQLSEENAQDDQTENSKPLSIEPEDKKNVSKFGFLKKIIPSLQSDRAYAFMKVPDTRSIAAFSEDGKSLIVASQEGHYYDAPIPKQQGAITDFEVRSLQ